MSKLAILPVILVTILIAYIPQIFGYAYSNGDPLFGFYPVFHVYGSNSESGDSTLWQAGLLGGFPEYLDLTGGFASPINWVLFRVLDEISAYAIALALASAFCLLASYLAAREFGISRVSGFFSAGVFTFGQHLTPWSNNLAVMNTVFILPLLMFSVLKTRRGSWFWGVLGALGSAYGIYMGQPQWVLIAFVGVFIFAVASRSSRMALVVIGIVMTTAVLAWPRIMATQQISDLSSRASGLSFAAAQINSMTPIDWLWYLLPHIQISKISSQAPVLYVGVLPLILAVLASIQFRKRVYATALLGMFLFSIAASFKYSPIFWIIHQLPFFEYFRDSSRWMYIGNFGIAILAGWGLDALISGQIHEDSRRRIQRALGWFLSVVLSVVALANIIFWPLRDRILKLLFSYFDLYMYPTRAGGLPLSHYHDAITSLVANNFRNLSLLNPGLILILAFLILSYILVRRVDLRGLSSRAILIVVGFTIVNLLAFHPNYYEIVPAATVQRTPDIAAEIWKREGAAHTFRVFSFLSGSAIDQKLRTPYFYSYNKTDQIIMELNLLAPNSSQNWGLDSIDGYNNLMPLRTAKVLASLGSERATAGQSLAYLDATIASKSELFLSRLSLLSMTNVKYVISAYPLALSNNFQIVSSTSSTRFNIPIYLYENKSVLPRIYLAHDVVYVSETDEEKNFRTIIESNYDFSKSTFIECADCAMFKNQPASTDSISIEVYRDGYIRLATKTVHGRWLVFSESNLPGWRITIDGAPKQSFIANYLFHGLPIPAGEHTVLFEYVGI